MDSLCTYVELHRIKLVKIVANTACTADNAPCGVLSLRVALWAGFEAYDDNGTSHFLEARKRFPNLVQSRLISDQV
jgi:hypothetical protein